MGYKLIHVSCVLQMLLPLNRFFNVFLPFVLEPAAPAAAEEAHLRPVPPV